MTKATAARSVMAEIEKHSFSELAREVGGVLYGTFEDGHAVVKGSLPALKADADQISVTFTHEVWDEIHAEMDAHHPGQRIVGWYHTHPGFGLFLSEYDLFIHRNFFADEQMAALVVDPIAGDLGWFGWKDGEVELLSSEPTVTPAAARPSTVTAVEAKRSTIGRLVPGLAVAAVALLVGGFVLGSKTGTDDTPNTRPAVDTTALNQALADAEAARSALAEQQAQNKSLTDQLADAQAQGGTATSFEYKIQSGDTLSKIADAVYQDPTDIQRLLDANPALRADPNVISTGDVLEIPLPEADR